MKNISRRTFVIGSCAAALSLSGMLAGCSPDEPVYQREKKEKSRFSIPSFEQVDRKSSPIMYSVLYGDTSYKLGNGDESFTLVITDGKSDDFYSQMSVPSTEGQFPRFAYAPTRQEFSSEKERKLFYRTLKGLECKKENGVRFYYLNSRQISRLGNRIGSTELEPSAEEKSYALDRFNNGAGYDVWFVKKYISRSQFSDWTNGIPISWFEDNGARPCATYKCVSLENDGDYAAVSSQATMNPKGEISGACFVWEGQPYFGDMPTIDSYLEKNNYKKLSDSLDSFVEHKVKI